MAQLAGQFIMTPVIGNFWNNFILCCELYKNTTINKKILDPYFKPK